MLPETTEWLRQSEYDIDTAEAMCRAGRYVYAAFMCQLAIEKALKGLVVELTGNTPPRTHNLIRLVKITAVELPEHLSEFIAVLNMAGVGTRYPDLLDDAIKRYPKEVAWDYLAKTKEVMQWLLRQIMSTQ
ncbi:MAG TPA: HEPN domain-containing protein [Firmicutes bacterium]|nr:HEPN domain-containing protein [Bacillota bacterium]